MIIWKEREVLTHLDQTKKNAIPELLWRFLARRVENESQLDAILSPTVSQLADPFRLKNMDKAVDRILQAFKNNEKICIYADFDLDGASGLAILFDSFTKLGFKNLVYYQPKRLSEGYGFHPHAVEDLQKEGVSLIITVDVGITSFAAFEKAKDLNLDVILTDHHLPAERLPEAYCIVNPNQKECDSGLGYLCGAGVAFYLLRALYRKLLDQNLINKEQFDLKEVLDFFCIGTLTDMVPLVEDNRALVKVGMKVLEQTKRPGLRYLLQELDLDGRELSSQDVAIKFAPKLNALSRMESEILPIHLYLEKDESKAQEIVAKMMKNNLTRQSLQQEAVLLAEEQLKNWGYEDFIYLSSDQFHRGIIGLVATKVANDRNVPVFVGSLNNEGVLVGSSRLPHGYESNLVEALSSCSQFLTRHGGHAPAAGFELLKTNEQNFIQGLSDYYQRIKKEPKPLVLEYDSVAEIKELTPQAFKWYQFLGPYGTGFGTPLFRFTKLELVQLKEIKGGHLKMIFRDETHANKADVLYFSPLKEKSQSLEVGSLYDVLGEIQMNYFNNKASVQILLKDFKKNQESL